MKQKEEPFIPKRVTGKRYDLDAMCKKAIGILNKDNTIITDLQLYGRLGCSSDYYYKKMMKSQYASTINALLDRGKGKASKTATDCLREAALQGNVKAMETYGRIADKAILKALAPNLPEESRDDDNRMSKEELIKEVVNLFEQSGLS